MSFCLKDVSYRYPRGKTVLDNIGFDLDPGKRIAVLGMSGSGKTTLLKILSLTQPGEFSGTIKLTLGDETHDYSKMRRAEATRIRLRHFGFVLQTPHFLSSFSCRQNITLPLRLQGVRRRERRARLGAFLRVIEPDRDDLCPLLKGSPNSLSEGQKQRLTLFRALIHDPDVVFADEPLASLDRKNQTKIMALVRRWHQGDLASENSTQKNRTLILVSHDIRSAWEEVECFGLLREGKMLEDRCWPKDDIDGPDAILDKISSDPC